MSERTPDALAIRNLVPQIRRDIRSVAREAGIGVIDAALTALAQQSLRIAALEAEARDHQDQIAELLKPREERIAALEADLLAIAQAVGIVYEADGHNPVPGPTSEIVRKIRALDGESEVAQLDQRVVELRAASKAALHALDAGLNDYDMTALRALRDTAADELRAVLREITGEGAP